MKKFIERLFGIDKIRAEAERSIGIAVEAAEAAKAPRKHRKWTAARDAFFHSACRAESPAYRPWQRQDGSL